MMNVIALVVVSAAVVFGLLLYLLTRPATDSSHYTRCKHCKQRIRYRSSQIGKPAMCPNCKGRFVYPPVVKAASS